MDTNGIDFGMINEARRRMMGQPASGAGIPGGMPTTQVPTSSNPMSQMGATPPPSPSAQMSSQGTQALGDSNPGEATMIVKGLLKHLDRLTSPKDMGM